MIIDRIFIYDFIDTDLMVEMFFKKQKAAEAVGVDFKIVYTGTTAHLY